MLNKKRILTILYKIILLLVLMFSLRLVTGARRYILFGAGLLAFLIGLFENRLGRKGRIGILMLFSVAFILVNSYYNHESLGELLPLRSTENQHIYQDSDMENGIFCEAYLRELIRNKKVYVPYSVKVLFDYVPIADEDERGAGFKPNYYWDNNYTRYFQEYAKECETDDALPKRLEVPEFIEGRVDDFQDMGITNDLLRYTFLLNQEHAKETKYFWYSWYYYSFAEEESRYPRLYMIPEDCESADSLIAIWDRDENIYLMSPERYAKVKG